MTNDNRKIFAERIASVRVTHDMEKKPKDPSSQKMKGERSYLFFLLRLWSSENSFLVLCSF